MHIFSFSILFNNFSSSVLNVFLTDDGGLYIFPIITLHFDLNIDLSISINTDSNMCVEKDVFFWFYMVLYSEYKYLPLLPFYLI